MTTAEAKRLKKHWGERATYTSEGRKQFWSEFKAAIAGQVKAHEAANPFTMLSFAEIDRDGWSVSQLQEALIELSSERQLVLQPWTGAMSDCPAPEFCLELAYDRKYYATTSSA